LERFYDALETGKIQIADLAPRIQQLRQRREQLQAIKYRLEKELSDRRVELADTHTSLNCSPQKSYARIVKSGLYKVLQNSW
jgi:chromosome segregation ATPase